MDDPLTPRPVQTSFPDAYEDIKTPTRDSFTSPYPQPQQVQQSQPQPQPEPPRPARAPAVVRSASTRSNMSAESANPSAPDSATAEVSDNETGDDSRPKKKKGQRFYCTDFPPCNLSFTRSEHLARHIRKHTGERPFQCHCLRRFSRLDNLRQHAQTVHVNEDIPSESLAATGTRFQRQIRTDRVRAPGRVRATTLGSSVGRGHSRNISGSSIGSVSDFGAPEDRRPPPPPQPSRLSVDPLGVGAGPELPYYPHYMQNNGYGSPTPVVPADSGSVAHAGLQSPITMAPRGLSWVEHPHVRRLSIPGPGPMLSSYGHYARSSYANNSMLASPTSSTFSESEYTDDPRRRTWHPGTQPYMTHRRATSGLSYHQTPDAPKPIPPPPYILPSQNVRLPGIDSFDRAHQKPAAPPLRALSPMEIDPPPPPQPELPRKRPHHAPSQSAPQSLETAFRDFTTRTGDSPITPRRVKRQAWYNGPLPAADLRTSPGGSSSGDGPQTPPLSTADYQPAIVHSNGTVEPLAVPPEPAKAPILPPPQPSTHFPQGTFPHRNGDMDRLDALVAVATSESQVNDH